MAFLYGEGSTAFDIVEAMNTALLDASWIQIIAQTRMYDGETRLSGCIWQGSGDGTDKIYIMARIPDDNNHDIYLDSMAGYDPLLLHFEQPGSIQQWLYADGEADVKQPMFTVTGDERFYWWMFTNTYRIIGIARMSIVYESFHLGFLNPVASERQYPYPMYVCGNGVATMGSWPDNMTGSITFPYDGSGYLRRADGTWRKFMAQSPADGETIYPSPLTDGTVFPYTSHNLYLVPNYKKEDAIVQDNFLLIPIMLQTNNPIDVNGLIRDAYWISGTRDIAAEQIVVFNSDQYMVFDTKQERRANTYFCIKIDNPLT